MLTPTKVLREPQVEDPYLGRQILSNSPVRRIHTSGSGELATMPKIIVTRFNQGKRLISPTKQNFLTSKPSLLPTESSPTLSRIRNVAPVYLSGLREQEKEQP